MSVLHVASSPIFMTYDFLESFLFGGLLTFLSANKCFVTVSVSICLHCNKMPLSKVLIRLCRRSSIISQMVTATSPTSFHRNVSQPGGTIVQEHIVTRDLVTSGFQDMQLSSFHEKHRTKFLGSLRYPEIQERQEQVSSHMKRRSGGFSAEQKRASVLGTILSNG